MARDWETYSNAKGMDLDDTGSMYGPGNFLNMDPPSHDELRKVVRGTFHARRVVELEPVVRRKVHRLIDGSSSAAPPTSPTTSRRRCRSQWCPSCSASPRPTSPRWVSGSIRSCAAARAKEDADTLDLRRKPTRHVAFGEGIHFCLGAPLARLQARVLFECVADRLPDYGLSGPVRRVAKVNSRGVEYLPVEFESSVPVGV